MGQQSFLISSSRHTTAVRDECAVFGPSLLSVLIVGESGTGKSNVAKELHRLSARGLHPLTRVGAAEASSHQLIQANFAGTVKGGFTDARNREGLLAAPYPVTLFLDDVGDIDLAAQIYLLDCVEQTPLHPVGSNSTFIPTARWIFGSQELLEPLKLSGKMRRDLAARIGLAAILLQPLRDHRDDIIQLAPHFLKKLAMLERCEVPAMDPGAMKALLAYGWPDNVRQLESALHVALVRARAGKGGTILRAHLPASVLGCADEIAPALDRAALFQSLEANSWNITLTATTLKMSRFILYRRMRHFGIEKGRA